MVSLMDRLLKLENLDLHLTPYKVLATGQDEGMLEFIPSRSLAQVLSFKDASLIEIVYLLYTISICLVLIDDQVTNIILVVDKSIYNNSGAVA